MKKVFALLIICLVAFVAVGQERTVNSSKTTLKTGYSYLQYDAVAADTLVETNQDTIDFVFNNQNHEAIEKVVYVCDMDSTAGADSVYYSLTGYNDLGGTGTLLTSGGALINEIGEIVEISKYYSVAGDTVSGSPMDLSFRHYVLRFIQDDNNSYDGGASFNSITEKLFFK